MPPPPIVPDPYGSEFIPGPGAPGDDYYQYEPTQDSQWQSQVMQTVLVRWISFDILTGLQEWRGPPPSMGIPHPMGMNQAAKPPPRREGSTVPPPGEESRCLNVKSL